MRLTAPSVLKLHKQGLSLRSITEEISLGLQSVRTIVDQGDGRDRTTIKKLERIDPERKLEASWRARQRSRDALPKRIADTLTKGRELKEARRTSTSAWSRPVMTWSRKRRASAAPAAASRDEASLDAPSRSSINVVTLTSFGQMFSLIISIRS